MIELRNVAKRYRFKPAVGNAASTQRRDVRESGSWFHALQDVSLQCEAGEVLGLLGRNGAGKTSTLRILSTALKPDQGTVHIDGVDIVRSPLEARGKIGFLSGTTGLYGRLTARENVEYFGRLHGMSPLSVKRRCDELFSRLEIHPFADKRADTLSAGMKQRCSIARAVIHDPRVVILDEPTTGLDVMSAKVVLDFIAEYKEKRIPVIFSTHHLHEVEKLCDRVCVINAGTSVLTGTTTMLGQAGGNDNLYDGFVHLMNQGA